MQDLTKQKCVPCEGGTKPFTPEEFAQYLEAVPNWSVVEDKAIERKFTFKNFADALNFLVEVGKIAQQEGHHPDMLLYGWNKVTITLSTHAIGGLSINDFIEAAKIDQLHRTLRIYSTQAS